MRAEREHHAFTVDGRGYFYQPGIQRVLRTGAEQVALLNSGDPSHMATRIDLLRHLIAEGTTAPWRGDSHGFDQHALYLHVANACNMRCVYCFAGGGTYGRDAALMSRETADRAVAAFLDRVPAGQTGALIFFGGEPLLAWKLMREVTDRARSLARSQGKAVDLHIVTNGTLLTQDVVDFLADNQFAVVVSVDGGDRIQNQQRPMRSGQPSFPLVQRHLDYLFERVPQVVARATYWDFGLSLAEIYEQIFRVGFCYVDIEPDFIDEGHDYDALLEQVSGLAGPALERALDKGYVGHLPILRKMRKLFSHSAHGPDRCGAGKMISAVSPDGNIYLCHRFTAERELTLGDVEHGYQREVHLGSPNDATPCSGCWNRYLCTSGCAYDSHRLLGNTHQPIDRWCRYSRRLSEVGIRVLDGIPPKDRSCVLGMSPEAARPAPSPTSARASSPTTPRAGDPSSC